MATISRRISYLFRRVLHMKASSRQIAGGVAIGVLIAFTPTLGIQMVLAALVATLFSCSQLPAVVAVQITNAFTVIPIYGFCYVLGVWLLKPFGFPRVDAERIRQILVGPKDMGIWEAMYNKMLDLSSLGWDAVAPLWVGGVVVGLVAAAVSYSITLRLVTGHRLITAERMARRAQRRLERIRREQALERCGLSGGATDERRA